MGSRRASFAYRPAIRAPPRWPGSYRRRSRGRRRDGL